MIKLWIDDQLDDPDAPGRHTPDGWVGVKTSKEAIKVLKTNRVIEISFDHDLGKRNARPIAIYIEREAILGNLNRMKWNVHSANPVGRQYIISAMNNAERYWEKYEQYT